MATTIAPNRLQESSHYITAYAVVLPDGHTLGDALNQEYWSHVALKLRQHDTIRIIPEDNSYFAELLVLKAARGFAQVKLLRHVPLEEGAGEPLADDESIYVKWFGPHLKFCVVRKSDGEKLKEGLGEKTAAEQWARDYLGSLSR